MRRSFLIIFVALIAATLDGFAQKPEPLPDRLPDGRSRELAILKKDHEKTLEDIAEIRQLAAELEQEVTEHTAHVTSLQSLHKAEKIEDLARRVQKRMKRIP